MANPEHLHLIRQSVEVWNQWRASLSSDLLVLEDLDLSEADLSSLYLSGANLSGCDLRKTNLNGTDLSGANLSEAFLEHATLNHAEISRANLNGAILASSSMMGANLAFATLVEANLEQANLQGANCNQAIFSEAYLCRADLSNTKLIQADLSFIDAEELILDYAILNRSILIESVLAKASLKNTIICEARLNKVNLREADLSSTRIKESNLQEAQLNAAILSDAELNLVNLELASLCQAQCQGSRIENSCLIGADLRQIDFCGASLFQSDLCNSDLSQSLFKDANLTGAKLTGACAGGVFLTKDAIIDDIVCDYIFLKEKFQERQPPQGNFAAGKVSDVLQQQSYRVCCKFPDKIDWLSFIYAFAQMQRLHPTIEMEIQSIQHQDEQILVYLTLPDRAIETTMADDFTQLYFDTYSILRQTKSDLETYDLKQSKTVPLNRLLHLLVHALSQYPMVFGEFPEEHLPWPLTYQSAVLSSDNGERKQVSHQRNRCPVCGSREVRRTRPNNWIEALLFLLLVRPYRCRACHHRFLRWGL